MKKFFLSIWRLLTGSDGALSFSKLIIVWVAWMYTTGRDLPEFIAGLLVVASQGARVLLAYLERRPLKEKTTTEVTEGPPRGTAITQEVEKLPPDVSRDTMEGA